MLHKISLMAAFAACLLIPTSVFAAHGHGPGGGGGVHVGGVHVGVHVGGVRVGVVHGGGRHFWHGRWYNYGVGPCWAQQPDGSWVWICD
jgi:hypothetical protein